MARLLPPVLALLAFIGPSLGSSQSSPPQGAIRYSQANIQRRTSHHKILPSGNFYTFQPAQVTLYGGQPRLKSWRSGRARSAAASTATLANQEPPRIESRSNLSSAEADCRLRLFNSLLLQEQRGDSRRLRSSHHPMAPMPLEGAEAERLLPLIPLMIIYWWYTHHHPTGDSASPSIQLPIAARRAIERMAAGGPCHLAALAEDSNRRFGPHHQQQQVVMDDDSNQWQWPPSEASLMRALVEVEEGPSRRQMGARGLREWFNSLWHRHHPPSDLTTTITPPLPSPAAYNSFGLPSSLTTTTVVAPEVTTTATAPTMVATATTTSTPMTPMANRQFSAVDEGDLVASEAARYGEFVREVTSIMAEIDRVYNSTETPMK